MVGTGIRSNLFVLAKPVLYRLPGDLSADGSYNSSCNSVFYLSLYCEILLQFWWTLAGIPSRLLGSSKQDHRTRKQPDDTGGWKEMASSRNDDRAWRRLYQHLSTPIFFLALLGSVVGICPLPHEGVIGEATVAALVALHRGPNCSRVELRGLQQAAAAGLAVRRVNEEHARAKDGLSIGLQVLDTCSEPEEAVKMALRSLVSSVQSSHLPPPLFLGFLGPDEATTLDAVQRVTNVFKLSHVTPISLRGRVFNPLHVVAVNPREKVKMILTLLYRLDWTSFSLLHSGDAISSEIARILVSEAKSGAGDMSVSDIGMVRDPICVLSIQELPPSYDAERYGDIIRELSLARKKGGIVVDLKGKQAAFAAAAAAAAAAGRGPPGVVIIGSTPGVISDLLRYVEVWGLGRSSSLSLPGSALNALGGAIKGNDDAAFVVSVSSTGLLPELAALQTGPGLSVLVIQDTVAVHNDEDEEEDEPEVGNEVPSNGSDGPEAAPPARPSIHRLADTVANSTLWPPYLLATRGCGGNGGSVSVVSSCVDAAATSNVEEFYLVQDPSVVPVMDAIRLFSSALSVAHSAKCGPNPGRCPELVSMTAEEWRSLLATAIVGGTKGRKVHFQMHRETSAQLYAKTPADVNPAFLVGKVTSRLRKVGNITGGGELNLTPGFRFPVSHNADGVRCKPSEQSSSPPQPPLPSLPVVPLYPEVTDKEDVVVSDTTVPETPATVVAYPTPPRARPPYTPPQPPPPPPPPVSKGKEQATDESDDDDGYIFGMDFLDGLGGDSMWEAIAILAAIGVGIIAVFGMCIYAIYAMFRVRSENDHGPRRRGTGRHAQRRQSNTSEQSIQS